MSVCSDGHKHVYWETGSCPMCLLKDENEVLEKSNKKLISDVNYLARRIIDLQEEKESPLRSVVKTVRKLMQEDECANGKGAV